MRARDPFYPERGVRFCGSDASVFMGVRRLFFWE